MARPSWLSIEMRRSSRCLDSLRCKYAVLPYRYDAFYRSHTSELDAHALYRVSLASD